MKKKEPWELYKNFKCSSCGKPSAGYIFSSYYCNECLDKFNRDKRESEYWNREFRKR